MNRNEKAAMLAELKLLMKDAHYWEAQKPVGGRLGTFSIKAVQAQRVVNAVKRVLSVGFEYSMKRKDVQILLEDLNREALNEVKQEMEANKDAEPEQAR